LIQKYNFFYLQFVLLRQPARLQKWMPTWWPIWNWHKNYTEVCASFYLLLLTTMTWLVRCHFLLDNASVNEIKILIFFSLGICLLWRALLRTYRSIPIRQLRG
jgi:hypothetical protein